MSQTRVEPQILSQLKAHPHWSAAQKILKVLQGQGKIAWLAGGCVRDALLGRDFSDLDIVTDATPEEIVKSFKKTVPVGISFGVVHVIEDQVSLEVATLRTDGDYKDQRRPYSVQWATPEADALRRDFTVNALFYDPLNQTVIDYVDGIKDLDQKLLKAVGDPQKRFQEDQLRLLRAIRFVSQLQFELEEGTWAAIKKMSADFTGVSWERIQQEWFKILNFKNPYLSLRLLFESGLGDKIFPEINKNQAYQQIAQMQNLGLTLSASRMLCLFQHLTEQQMGELLDRLKYPKAERKQLLDEHRFCLLWKEKSELSFKMAKLFNQCRPEVVTPILEPYRIHRFIEFYLSLCDSTGKLPKALVQGEDAIRLGVKPGPEMGRWLESIYEYQVLNRVQNPEQLMREFKNS